MSIQEKIYRYFEQYEDLHVLFMFDPNGVHRMELMGAEWPENYLYETYDKGSRGQVIDFFLQKVCEFP
jgi:hypothetical protein